MRLVIRRDQKDEKGIFGGHKGVTFLLSGRALLTPDEQQLIVRYKVEDYPLTWHQGSGTSIPGVTVGQLVYGITQEAKDVTTLLHNEKVIKQACEEFKSLLTLMATFGGEEVIDF